MFHKKWMIARLIKIALVSPTIVRSESTELPSVGNSSLVIANESAQSLNFSVRPERGDWGNYTLNPGSNMTISCDECEAKFFEFNMNTDNRFVHYDLKPSVRYVLRWNSDKSVWDILEKN